MITRTTRFFTFMTLERILKTS